VSDVRAAAVYARISSDQTGQGLGVRRQLEDCRRLAASKGWRVAEEYVDNDVSAFSGKARPGYAQMVADIRDGLRDAVIVYNLDRLTRRPVELEEFVAHCDAAGVRDIATVTADIDLGTDDGLFMARIFAAFAAKESGRKSARQLRKMEQNALDGQPHGGSNRPFGYGDDKVSVDEAEAVVFRALVARFLAGESVRSLTTWLNEQGVRTVVGGPWRTTVVSAMLANPRYAGLRAHRGAVVGPAVWAGLISEDDHRRVLARFAHRAVSGRRTPQRYALSGLLRCGKCGNTLYSSPRKSTRRYVCLSGPDHGGCGRLTVVADPLERLMADLVIEALDTPELADALAGRAAADEHAAELAEAIAGAREQLGELADVWSAKQISMAEWLTARKPIEARIEATERHLARLTRADALHGLVGQGDQLRRQWGTLNLSRQHAIIAAVVDHVVIGPGQNGARTLDPNRVQPVWRF
jgi:DNA invertase Pin-like site-specific DNA recombinase